MNDYEWGTYGTALSEREKQVLIDGLKNESICEQLYLSLGTVKNYVTSIYKKLSIASRTDAAQFLKRRYKQK